MSEFDWSLEDPVVPEQQAITCYQNDSKHVVIRQQGEHFTEDAVIVVAPIHAVALCRAILDNAGIDAEIVTKAAPKVKDTTAAERSRKYRQNKRDAHRDGSRDATVTGVTRAVTPELEFEENEAA